MKYSLIWIIILVAIAGGAYLLLTERSVEVPAPEPEVTADTAPKTPEPEVTELEVPATDDTKTVIGTSVGGNDITAYHFGAGEREVLFVGGIHGGYEWNTVLLAYELMDYLEANPDAVPDGLRVTVIPVLNPDGLERTVGTSGRFTPADVPASEVTKIAGRFNENGVDLNRNFDCEWKETGVWREQAVKGGSAAFSEPESQAIRDYARAQKPVAAVVWYSAAGGVFASNCRQGVLSETSALTKLFAAASGYPAYESFDYYTITGDMVNWLAKEKIPAISILLSDHTNTEWEKNLKGITALLARYGQ